MPRNFKAGLFQQTFLHTLVIFGGFMNGKCKLHNEEESGESESDHRVFLVS